MTAKFFAILTHQGAARLANAAALGTKLNLTQLAVGDGGGTLPTPDPAQTALKGEQRRAALNLLSVDPNNTSQIIAEQVIPENEGGFWIREIGLYDDAGILIAVANCPETYKPQLQEGSGRTQTIRMVLIVSSSESVTLKIDPAVVLATRKYADDLLAKHVAEADPHTQYALKKSPTFTGKPVAPTAPKSENSTQLATTAFVKTALEEKQPLDATLTALAGKDVAGLLDYLGVPDLLPEEAPFPDVWIPFSGSLHMLAGNGPYDRITLGSDYVELPSRSATFTRASTATYIDKSGVLQTAAINEPRFEKEGLLIEGQSTNLMVQSNPQIMGGAWTRSANHTYTNDGAEFLRVLTTTGTGGTYNASLGTLQPGTYTCSCWVKVIAGSFRFGFEKVTNGVSDIPAADATEFVRVSKTITIAEATSGTIILYSSPSPAGGSEFIVGRVQVEALSFATSYIPTSGASATRVAEDVRMDLSGNIPLLPGEMSLAMQVNQPYGASGEYRTLMRYADTTLMIYSGTNILRREGVAGQNNNLNVTTNGFNSPGANIFAVSQGATSSDNVSAVLNGTLTKKVGWLFSNPASPSGQMTIGTSSANRFVWGHIRNLRIWHRALSDAQLRSLR